MAAEKFVWGSPKKHRGFRKDLAGGPASPPAFVSSTSLTPPTKRSLLGGFPSKSGPCFGDVSWFFSNDLASAAHAKIPQGECGALCTWPPQKANITMHFIICGSLVHMGETCQATFLYLAVCLHTNVILVPIVGLVEKLKPRLFSIPAPQTCQATFRYVTAWVPTNIILAPRQALVQKVKTKQFCLAANKTKGGSSGPLIPDLANDPSPVRSTRANA